MTMRKFGAKSNGGSFDEPTIEAVWRKGQYVSGSGADERRKDACGATMRRGSHGATTDLGWEVDHIMPVARGGTDALSNLQPLHWKNNRQKSDSLDQRYCVKMT